MPSHDKREDLSRLTRQARLLHEEWVAAVGEGRLSEDGAKEILRRTAARSGDLAADLARQAISVQEHNDQRFVMVMAMRRFIDGGCDGRAGRLLAREMHDLFEDSPPLPHPKYRFTFDWVSPHSAAWEQDLEHLRGKPAVRGLEIGCFEGQSAC
ncbi:MAG TPA: hypothetical protein VGJ82_10200, partial [Thermoanaerobaculia bacterium]